MSNAPIPTPPIVYISPCALDISPLYILTYNIGIYTMIDRKTKKVKTMTIEDAMRAQNLDEFINKHQTKNQFQDL